MFRISPKTIAVVLSVLADVTTIVVGLFVLAEMLG